MTAIEQTDLLLLLKLLADEQRLKMVGMMTHQEWNVSDLAERLQLSEPTISHHVSKMHQAWAAESAHGGQSAFLSCEHAAFDTVQSVYRQSRYPTRTA